jgi:Flp pilus assembly protein TadD
MVRLALTLIKHEDTETAQAALRTAVDTEHPPVVAVASLGLGNLLALEGDPDAARAALQRAIDSGYPQIAQEAARSLQALPLSRQAAELPLDRTPHHGADQPDGPRAGDPVLKRSTHLTDGPEQADSE